MPKLVLWDQLVRAAVCSYDSTLDVLRDLTARDMRELKNTTFVDNWEVEPVLRKWPFKDMWIYGIWGYPEMVAITIRKIAKAKRLPDIRAIRLPASNLEEQVMYVVGAIRRV